MSTSHSSPQGPCIALVTPSFNAGKYVQQTFESVIDQGYENLEYIVVDGGSSDHTVQVIKDYEHSLTAWSSEPDNGMYDAINKGFDQTTGEIMGWINSDDILLPGTLKLVAQVFELFPEVEWISTRTPIAINEHGSIVKLVQHPAFSTKGFSRGAHMLSAGWPALCHLQQEGTFWRRSLWDRAGGKLDTSYKLAGDFELWCRFARCAQLVSIDVPLGAFRYHPEQASGLNYANYIEESKRAFAENGYKKPNFLDTLAIYAKKVLSDSSIHKLADKGLAHRPPRITYNWGARTWNLEGGTDLTQRSL
ncbi:MAG: glycosyltransferase family 2 protein [Phycisphaerales bacterium]